MGAKTWAPPKIRTAGASQPDIWIYAAILAAENSFVVDNWGCGSELGNLNIYGSVAQNYRGIVGTVGGSVRVISAPPSSATEHRATEHRVRKPAPVYCPRRSDPRPHVRRINVLLNGHRLATRTTKRGVTVGRPGGLQRAPTSYASWLETTHGRKITGTRTYHTCAATPIHPKRPPTL